MNTRKIWSAQLLLAALAFSPGQGKPTYRWELDIPMGTFDYSVDPKFERFILAISTPAGNPPGMFGQYSSMLKAYDRIGNLVWEGSYDSCFLEAKRAPILWTVKGREGIILDRMTGKVLRKSKELLGGYRGEGFSWGPCVREPIREPAASLSPDGRYLFTNWCAEDQAKGCEGDYWSKVTDTKTGKAIWHIQVLGLNFNSKLMPDDSSFFINSMGIHTPNGKRLWNFPCMEDPEGWYSCPKLKNPRYWEEKMTGAGIQAVSRDGRIMVGASSSALEGETSILFFSSGNPAKPWREIHLAKPIAFERDVFFSDDGKYLAAFDDKPKMPPGYEGRQVDLYKTDGTFLWSKLSSYTVTGDPNVGRGGAGSHGLQGNKVLLSADDRTEVYALDGTFLKSIRQPPGGFVTEAGKYGYGYKVHFLDDRRYYLIASSAWSARYGYRGKIQIWEGSLDDPD